MDTETEPTKNISWKLIAGGVVATLSMATLAVITDRMGNQLRPIRGNASNEYALVTSLTNTSPSTNNYSLTNLSWPKGEVHQHG